MPWFLNPAALGTLVLAVVLSGLGGTYFGHKAGARSVQQQWDKQAKEQAEALAAHTEATRKREAHLQDAIDVLQRENKDARKTIATRDTALRNSLRNRPDRDYSAKVPTNSSLAVGVSGAELARRDGEFLAGYSADAALVEKALKQCEVQYEKIRQQYSGETSEDSSQRDKQK